MKKVFTFKKGEAWDGDEYIVHFLEDYLLTEPDEKNNIPHIKDNYKVTLIIEKKEKKK